MRDQCIAVLLVDDYEPFRIIVSSLLSENPALQIVAEASDGLESARKAWRLQPDLVLLDISLPGLNGIVAARQIRKLAPKSKIVFLSQETSPEVVEEAMRSGASGYVVKANVRSELLPTIERVLPSKQSLGRDVTPRIIRTYLNP